MSNPTLPYMLHFDEYIRMGEPSQQERAAYWRTAIGLQAVDGLQTSEYLKATAIKHIEGEIDIDQARQLIKTYYQSKATRETIDEDQQEADKVSANFRNLLMGEQWDLRNRYLHISPSPEWQVQPQLGMEIVSEKPTKNTIAENIVENIVENLSAMRGRIVKIIWKNPRATAQSISKEVGIAPRNVQEHLKYLQKAGILRRIGPTKGGHWEVLG